jgi:predicted CXXCH cytochrome family protein
MISKQVCFFLLAGRYMRLFTVVLFAVGVAGCSRQAGHQVLTFFFTGVPQLEEQQAEQKTAPGATPALKEERNTGAAGQSPVKKQNSAVAGQPDTLSKVPEAPRLFSHPVWAEGDCSPCHEGSGVFGFQPGGQPKKNIATKIFNSGGGMPGKLRHPKEKICTTCHTGKTGLRAIKDNLWLHNPTAKGDCLACHDAHQSKQRGVLRRPPDQLCQPCHPAEKLAATAMHRNSNEPCLSCHNPHMGKDRRLLIQDYQEIKQAAQHEQ